MAITAQELNVILSARDKQFTRAMDKAQKRVERFANKSSKELNRTTKAFGGLSELINKFGGVLSTGVVAGGLIRSIDNATRLAKELTNLSTLSGLSAEEFQKFAFAAKSVGIEQDKVADILKDVNDKFGDFFAVGGGPLQDFFEQIAPKVGVTAEAFRNLSSADALGLYVETLEKAGVSQQQMTFFMEALASDATVLAPLLRDGGRAMDEFAQKASDMGIILENDVIASANNLRDDFNEVMQQMTTKMNNFFMTAAVGFADIFGIETDRTKLGQLEEELDDLITKIRSLTEERKVNIDILTAMNEAEEKNMVMMSNQNATIKRQTTQLDKLNAEYTTLVNKINALKETLAPTKVLDLGELTVGQDGEEPDKKVALMRGQIVGLADDFEDLISVTNVLEKSLEDTFMSAIDGTKSFKDSMRLTAAAVIKELYRVMVVQRLVNATLGFFGVSSGGPLLPIGNSASGGAVYAGQPTVVGEHGREVFVPSSAGRILSVPQSKAALGGGEGVTINQTINVSTGVQQTVRNEIKTLLPQIAESAKSAVADSKRRGGSYGRAFS